MSDTNIFDFLKECNSFGLYEKACSCVRIFGDINDVLLFRVFCEAALKDIYYTEYKINPNGDRTKLYDLLNNENFLELIQSKYHFNDIGTLNRIIRVKGNSAAHGTKLNNLSDEQRIKIFKTVYKLATCIYEVRTFEIAPTISTKEVKELLANIVSQEDIKKVEEEYKEILEEIRLELAKKEQALEEKDAVLQQAIDEARNARNSAEAIENEKRYLEEQLEQEKLKNINKDELVKRQKQIEEKEVIIARCLGYINVLKDRLEKAEESQNEEQIIRLNEKNQKLEEKLLEAEKERDDIHNQLEILIENSCDKSVVAELEEKLRKLEVEVEIKAKEYADSKRVLSIKEGKSTTEDTEISKIEEQYAEYTDILDRIEKAEINRDKVMKRLKKWYPVCSFCGERLVLTKNRDAFRCVNWEKEKSRGENSYQKLTPEWNIIKELDDVVKKERLEAEKWLDEHFPGRQGMVKPITAPDSVLQSYEMQYIEYKEYPFSLSIDNPKSFVFQTLGVPSVLFEDKDRLKLKNHAKFRVWYDDNLTNNPIAVASQERTVYSLVLRLLNRGFVLKTDSSAEKNLIMRFGEAGFSKTSLLTDYVEYNNPVLVCDSERERKFAEYYFPKVLGKSWASYVSSQVALDELLPDNYRQYEFCRADFLVSGYSDNIKSAIIELDGYEHKYAAIYDKKRRLDLRKNKYEVFSFANSLVDNQSDYITQELSNYFDAERLDFEIDVNSKLLVACKLQHQFAVAIVKALEKGYVPARTHFSASVSSPLFTKADLEYILAAAIAEVEMLIRKYAELYGVDVECELDDTNTALVEICVGDGKPGFEGILIRDNNFCYDYLCNLEPFDETMRPIEDVDETTLEFFLKYIFGYDEFRQGQLPAIRRLLEKKDTIVLLPTGSGKSIVYQLSSFLAVGMIVVISPLKSLINDQIFNLAFRCGINNAIGITSVSGKGGIKQREQRIKNMKCNATSLLYISPERIQIPSFRESIYEMLENNNVYAVAIDEAHCISEWGHDFRPAYLVLGRNCKKLFSSERELPALIALTGTASIKVREDIKRTLQITESKAVIYPDTFERDELFFSVVECSSNQKIDNIALMIRDDIPEMFDSEYEDFIIRDGNNTNAGIVFTPFTRGKSEQYSAKSVKNAIKKQMKELAVDNYYSKPPEGWDQETWDAKLLDNAKSFRENELNLLVATKAFGMGIDKGNIRYTIHDGIPQSIEAFYQEAGRAGRDGNDSQCIVLFSNDNRTENTELLNPNLTLEELRISYLESLGDDDIHAQLYFHLNNFRGIIAECNTLDKIVDILFGKPSTNKKIAFSIWKEDFSKAERRDNGKQIAQALVRLIQLGIVEDYQFEYGKGIFYITIGSVDIHYIENKYVEYVKSFSAADVGPQREKLRQIKDSGLNAIKDIFHLMVEYSYTQIEAGRRRQLITIYETMLKVSSHNRAEQDDIIKDEINKYFALPKRASKNDPIQAISSSEEIRFDIALAQIKEPTGKKGFLSTDRKRAGRLAGRTIRELESASTRPDMILLKVITQIISASYSANVIANDLSAVERFAKETYGIDDSAIDNALSNVCNLALNVDSELFDVIVSEIASYRKITVNELLLSLASREELTDRNREYVVMSYYTQRVRHLL